MLREIIATVTIIGGLVMLVGAIVRVKQLMGIGAIGFFCGLLALYAYPF